MLRLLALVLCLTPLVATAQPLAAEQNHDAVSQPERVEGLGVEEAVEAPAVRQQLAVVVRRADSCSSGSSSSSSCDGGGCGDADIGNVDCGSSGGDGGGCNIAAAGCIVAGAAAVYVIYRLLSNKRSPRRDSLFSALGLPEGGDALLTALATRFDVVLASEAPPTADVVLVVRETSGVRHGVGMGQALRRLAIRATDASGHPLVLADGPLPTTEITLDVSDRLPEDALALAHRLADR